jgi:hypothetical protein
MRRFLSLVMARHPIFLSLTPHRRATPVLKIGSDDRFPRLKMLSPAHGLRQFMGVFHRDDPGAAGHDVGSFAPSSLLLPPIAVVRAGVLHPVCQSTIWQAS